jgi:opacity protein-like surface antigen
MTNFSTLAVIAAVAAVASALPASAQSFDPEAGTGNVVQFSYAPTASQNGQIAVRQGGRDKMAARLNGLHAFAMVPGGRADREPNDPALTGGGSLGYNQNLLNY